MIDTVKMLPIWFDLHPDFAINRQCGHNSGHYLKIVINPDKKLIRTAISRTK